MNTRITYSRDGAYYYVESVNPKNRARNWVGIEKIPGPVPDEKKQDTWRGWAEVKTDGGEVYHREVLGFAFWKVKSGETAEIQTTDDLYKDYGALHDWGEEKPEAPQWRELNKAEAFARTEIDAGRVDMEGLRVLINSYVEATGKADISLEAAAYIFLKLQGAAAA